MTLTQSDKCIFCKEEKGTLSHLFWNCSVIKTFISDVQQLLKGHNVDWKVDCKTFILGIKKVTNVNFIFFVWN
jgi:hypothetical protein